MLFLVGLGLESHGISLAGLESAKKSDVVYLEAYTSVFTSVEETLREVRGLIGRDVQPLYREAVESAKELLAEAKEKNVALLVVGDPFCATTHADLYLRCAAESIPVVVHHASSIISAIGCVGLEVYRYGHSVSIPFFTEKWKPTSFIEKLIANYRSGLHSLCLLDIKTHERTEASMFMAKAEYEPPRFMKANEAAQEILEASQSLDLTKEINESTLCVAACRVGTESQTLVTADLGTMAKINPDLLGSPLHSLVVPSSQLHEIEMEMLNLWRIKE